MYDDRVGLSTAFSDCAALAALLRKGKRLLVGTVRNADALETDTAPEGGTRADLGTRQNGRIARERA